MGSKRVICVVGLGYVGLPLALACTSHHQVIGYDCNVERIDALRAGRDSTGTLEGDLPSNFHLTAEAADIQAANFYIIAVPTPVAGDCRPDLSLLEAASETVGGALSSGNFVVYESTVYPGVTEQICIPCLEQASGLVGGKDFKVGYSPERVSPGDDAHTFSKITKIIAGQDREMTQAMADLYGKLIEPELYVAESIQVAEAAKVLENTQRDVNIALMNEMALLFQHIGLDTQEVLKAAGTKWNFLPFTPGLVGGHCIGVDPYYLTHLAKEVGYSPNLILAGRKINDAMGEFVAEQTLAHLHVRGVAPEQATINVLGLTFKENCTDIRNSRVGSMVRTLEKAGATVYLHDPIASPVEAMRHYNLSLVEWESLPKAHAIILAVPHDVFSNLSVAQFQDKLQPPFLLQDVKACLDQKAFKERGISLWRL